MKCRDFDIDCAEWLKGRLAETRAEEMRRHEASCHKCAAIARAERSVMAVVGAQPEPSLNADLWPQLLHRLERQGHASDAQAMPARRFHWRPTMRLGWGIAGVAAGLLAYMTMRPTLVDQTAMVPPEDEVRVVEMIAATEPVRYVEASTGGLELSSDFEIQRGLLVGDGD